MTVNGHGYTLIAAGIKYEGNVLATEKLAIIQGLVWSLVKIPLPNGSILMVDGIPNEDAKDMMAALEIARHAARVQQQVNQLLENFDNSVRPIVVWADSVRTACATQLKRRGWLTQQFKTEQSGTKPSELLDVLEEPAIRRHLENQPQVLRNAITLWRTDFNAVADSINERHLARELEEHRAFFETVEKSPLTAEQAKAVICFDNRVLLIASAGSGKTSTMVAKVGYALKKGYVSADRILLLAFNKDAAKELGERIKARLGPLGLPVDKVASKTFHAFGQDVIGAVNGERPSLAPWLEGNRDLSTLLELVDDLKDRDLTFRRNWEMFRFVLGQDLPTFGKEREAPDAWNADTKQAGFRTANGDIVKSRGEQMLANWLFYNGVEYVYEMPYEINTADVKHRQYRPDFYFPSIKAYLEHWALNEHGEAPPDFVDYKEGMAWKRHLHAEHGTTLLETTSATLWSGAAFEYLTRELTQRGVTLDPNPDRPVQGLRPIENPRLVRTFRSFMTHAKGNRLDLAGLRKRLELGSAGHFKYRHEAFLWLFERLWDAWEAKLRRERCIDFEDMLNLAVDCLDQGRWVSPYDLVMVDEFQDASDARARLAAALVKSPGRCVFAVGDDWQSINRFAGADLGCMTDFERRFGTAQVLRLERTFRCPQSLCDISSAFIQKNPRQLKKSVISEKPVISEPVRIVRLADEADIQVAVQARIQEIEAELSSSSTQATVYVLGRYQKDDRYVLMPSRSNGAVKVEFKTIHASKGLEADHVILPRMTSETLGFPSRVADDPILQLAMPSGDTFENAEERRLFYVALTRARQTVTLITIAKKESPFVLELVRDFRLKVRGLDGDESAGNICAACNQGLMVNRPGRNGNFLGCSRFPICRNTQSLTQQKPPARTKRPSVRRQPRSY